MPNTKLPKTQTMIAAAAVITRAVSARPSATAVALSRGAVVLLADAGQQEHLVVHRQPEDDGEQQHRRPRLDGPSLPTPMRLRAPAPLEHRDDDAVGGADRQQVHHDRLQRHEQAAEHDHEQQERQQQHRADEDRQAIGGVRREVVDRRGEPADLDVEAASRRDRRGRRRRAGGDTRSAVASSCGAVVGNTWMIAAVAVRRSAAAVAANATPRRRRSAVLESSLERGDVGRRRRGLRDEQQRAVEAGPKPSESRS